MEKIVAQVVTINNISEDEMNTALAYLQKERQKKAEKEAQEEGLRLIREGIALIEATGQYATLPPIGGKYVSYHHPRIRTDNICISAIGW